MAINPQTQRHKHAPKALGENPMLVAHSFLLKTRTPFAFQTPQLFAIIALRSFKIKRVSILTFKRPKHRRAFSFKNLSLYSSGRGFEFQDLVNKPQSQHSPGMISS